MPPCNKTDIAKTFREECKQLLITTFQQERISLLRFLEVYYPYKEAITYQAIARMQQQVCNTYLSDVFSALSAAPSAGVFDLKDHIPLSNLNQERAFGVYCQVTEGQAPQCVVNNIVPGHGKGISRFLSFYPTAVDQLRQTLQNLFPNHCLTEIKDASLHNTNLYPSLGDAIVTIPGVSPPNKELLQIPLQNLFLQIDEQGDLCIQDQEGHSILPIDLAMEDIQRKSALAQFLSMFGPSPVIGLQWTDVVESFFSRQLEDTKTAVVTIPRICFGKYVVVGRKKWIVRKKHLLKRLQGIDSWKAFAVLRQWRDEQQIPDEVYVRLTKHGKHTHGHYKPQYINFDIPLLAEYFVSILNKAETTLSFTEMLPRPEDILPNEQGQRYVKEYILNFM